VGRSHFFAFHLIDFLKLRAHEPNLNRAELVGAQHANSAAGAVLGVGGRTGPPAGCHVTRRRRRAANTNRREKEPSEDEIGSPQPSRAVQLCDALESGAAISNRRRGAAASECLPTAAASQWGAPTNLVPFARAICELAVGAQAAAPGRGGAAAAGEPRRASKLRARMGDILFSFIPMRQIQPVKCCRRRRRRCCCCCCRCRFLSAGAGGEETKDWLSGPIARAT
jgi:hypothetical protein